MSLRQRKSRPSLLLTLLGRREQSRDRRRDHLGPVVTRLEERTLLTIPTLTTLADSAASITYGQTEMFTATVTTDPHSAMTPSGGTVTFMDGSTALGTRPLTSGTAQISVSGLGAGSHDVTAIYSGTNAFGTSRTPVTPSPVIATVAGGGSSASQPALYALNSAAAVAVDSSGDLFIAEGISYYHGNTQEVCEVNHSTGAVTVVAGNGSRGYSGDGGPATAAELAEPNSLALDGSGDLFIADSGNDVVREVNLKTGIITTVAGDGAAGDSGDGGPATAAELSYPSGVAVNGSGDLFIADALGSVVREVNLNTGTITTVAGNGTQGDTGDGGPATAAELSGPTGLALDGSGDLMIADSGNDVVREVNQSTGIISTIAGDGTTGYSGDGGPATAAQLSYPSSFAMDDSGDLFISDSDNNAVREVNLNTGIITTVAGNGTEGYTGDGGPSTGAELSQPIGLALDGSGDLFIADWWNNAVREVNLGTGTINTVAGGNAFGDSGDGGLATAAELSSPGDVAVDGSGNLFIADSANNVVREVNAQTDDITTVAGNGIAGYSGDGGLATAAELSSPSDVAVDHSGDLFIADLNNNVVREVNAQTGDITTIAGNGTAGYSGDGGLASAAELSGPDGLALDGSGDLFIADSGNNVVREVDLNTGIVTTVVGNGTEGDSGDGGLATAAELSDPNSVALDPAGDLFIADTDNDVIREVNAGTGDITTVAGNDNAGDHGDGGNAAGAELSNPVGVAVDGSGHLFIADSGNDAIREVDLKSGIITTLAGTSGQAGYSGDGGPATAAQLDIPDGVAIDSAGNLFISDYANNDIREVSTPTNLAQVVTVGKALLTVTANDATKVVGAPTPDLTDAIAGFVNGDTASSLSTPAVVSTTASSASPAGTYPITVSGATAANYAIRFVNGTLTVTPLAPAPATPTPATPPRVVSIAFAPATVKGVAKARIAGAKHKAPRAILVQLEGAVNASAVVDLNNYSLTTLPRGRKEGKRIGLSGATYDTTTRTVTLVTGKKAAASRPLQLTINAAGLGLPGGNVVAVVSA